MAYGGYDPMKSFWENLQKTTSTVGGWLTPNVYAAPQQDYQRPINPQGTPSYIPPDQAQYFSGAAKGNVANPPTMVVSGGAGSPQVTTPVLPGPTNQSPWTSAPQQASGGGGPTEEDLNRIYQPGMESLNVLEQNYRNQLPGAIGAIEASYGQGAAELEQNLRGQNELLTNQQTNVTTAQQSALAQARQLYNELAQRYGAMFGSRTSAGPFAMEILGREAQKQFGNIGAAAESSVAAIDAERRRILDFTNTQKQGWEVKKTEAIRQINVDFTNQLGQIQAQRGALETAKAQARVQALTDARNALQTIQAADVTFNRQIELFNKETERQLAMKASSGTGYDTAYLNATAKVGDILKQYGPQAAQQAATQAGLPYNYAPREGYEYVQNAAGDWVEKKKDEGIFPNAWPLVGRF